MNAIPVTLYTRKGCTLCENAHLLLIALSEEYPLSIQLFDISTDPEIERKYTIEIPVIEVRGEVICISTIDTNRLRQKFESLLKI